MTGIAGSRLPGSIVSRTGRDSNRQYNCFGARTVLVGLATLFGSTTTEHGNDAGRDPAEIGLEVWMSPVGEPEEWQREVRFWKDAGVTHITCNNSYSRHHHKRIPETSLSAHIAGLEEFVRAVERNL